MKRKNCISGALAWAVVLAGPMMLPTTGQEAPAASSTNVLSLDETIRRALVHSPALQAADGRVIAAAGRAAQAAVWPNPELELSTEEWPLTRGRGFSDAKQTIGVAQTLPWPGKKNLDRRIGLAGQRATEEELALRRTELVRDVKAAFFKVLAAERAAQVASELANVAESSAATARKRVDAGAIAYQEQLRAEIELEQARTELTSHQRDLATARRTLVTLVGLPHLIDASFSGTLAESPDQRLLEPTSEAWLATHPSLAAARAEVERAALEHRRARLEPYPDMKVGVAGGRIGDSDQSIVEFRLSVPLPIIDRSKGRQQETRANVSVAEAELGVVRHQLLREWANAMKRYQAAADQVANYRDRILPKAADALRLIQVGFEEGKFNFIDVLDTQRTAAQARLTYVEKLFDLNVAQAELDALLHPSTVLESHSPSQP